MIIHSATRVFGGDILLSPPSSMKQLHGYDKSSTYSKSRMENNSISSAPSTSPAPADYSILLINTRKRKLLVPATVQTASFSGRSATRQSGLSSADGSHYIGSIGPRGDGQPRPINLRGFPGQLSLAGLWRLLRTPKMAAARAADTDCA